MNKTQLGIITLLKSAVTGEALPLPEDFSLEEACPIIKKQGLVTLAYEGAVLCGISRQKPVMKELFRTYCSVLLCSERQMAKVEKLLQSFEENAIDYLPFKGCVLKALYPKPELRVMGDADILIRLEQYEQIKPILRSMGFHMETESDCELIWKHPDLYLELHQCMVQPSQLDYYAYFGDGWSRAIPIEGHRYGFTPEDVYVYLFMHFTKHYRCGGIGCRHVVDLWVFRQAHPEMDQRYISRELEKLRLSRFHENCIKLMDVWFGSGQPDEVTGFISKRIFSGGAWGNLKDYHVFVELTRQKTPDKVKNSRLKFAVNLLFPSLQQMQKKYPVLLRFPFLLPGAWVVRGIAVLLTGRDKLSAAVKAGSMISDDALKAHQEVLRKVGLEWTGYRED